MATHACIAKKTKAGFLGRYHHTDGYPQSLGEKLWKVFHGHFNQDIKAMVKFLIDDHTSGWSSIVDADFNLPTKWSSHTERYKLGKALPHGPACFCCENKHRNSQQFSKREDVTHKNASLKYGCFYLYIFDQETIGEVRHIMMDVLFIDSADRFGYEYEYREYDKEEGVYHCWSKIARLSLNHGKVPNFDFLNEESFGKVYENFTRPFTFHCRQCGKSSNPEKTAIITCPYCKQRTVR